MNVEHTHELARIELADLLLFHISFACMRNIKSVVTVIAGGLHDALYLPYKKGVASVFTTWLRIDTDDNGQTTTSCSRCSRLEKINYVMDASLPITVLTHCADARTEITISWKTYLRSNSITD